VNCLLGLLIIGYGAASVQPKTVFEVGVGEVCYSYGLAAYNMPYSLLIQVFVPQQKLPPIVDILGDA